MILAELVFLFFAESRNALGGTASGLPFQIVDFKLELRDPRELRFQRASVGLDLRGEVAARRAKLAPNRVDDLAALVQQLDHRVEFGACDVERSGFADTTNAPNVLHA
jgi:hypothetical protein